MLIDCGNEVREFNAEQYWLHELFLFLLRQYLFSGILYFHFSFGHWYRGFIHAYTF